MWHLLQKRVSARQKRVHTMGEREGENSAAKIAPSYSPGSRDASTGTSAPTPASLVLGLAGRRDERGSCTGDAASPVPCCEMGGKPCSVNCGTTDGLWRSGCVAGCRADCDAGCSVPGDKGMGPATELCSASLGPDRGPFSSSCAVLSSNCLSFTRMHDSAHTRLASSWGA